MKYRVAAFTIDPARYQVSAGDSPVPVEPKVFDLLVYLMRHRQRVLTRDELFREVWDGREVSDATLSNHVMAARRLLGDNGELQRTIQTVRGRGYQFVAEVVEVPDTVPAAPDAGSPPAGEPAAGEVAAAGSLPRSELAPSESPSPPRARRSWLHAGSAGALLAALATVIAWRGDAPPAGGSDARPYVLVVPFDAAGDPTVASEPLADQVTRELIGNLRAVSGLRVVPAPSAFTFKADKSREHIRAQLPEVRYVLDGSVVAERDGRLRISTALEDLAARRVVWGEDYGARGAERERFALQSTIAAAVSRSLNVAVRADERSAMEQAPTADVRAYALYVAGRHELERFSHQSLPRAIALFDQAITQDPRFFNAYLARSEAYRQLFGYFEPPVRMMQSVVDSLAEAQALRPDSAEVWASLGLTYVMAWRWREAWTALGTARLRDPTLAQTELGLALYYAGLGEADAVQRALENANRLDPLNIETADWGNWALFMVGRHDAARAWADQKMRQHPDIGPVHSGAGVGASMIGDHARAIRLAERGAELDDSPLAMILLAQVYGYAGQHDRVAPLLQRAAAAGTYVCPYESAVAWLSVGDREQAFMLLEEAVDKRSNCLIFLRVDPRMQPLRSDPRFDALLARVGLDDTAVASYRR
jgi:DNA-binding winged helix-turn-helix (wHTH) protein/TolB-like protein